MKKLVYTFLVLVIVATLFVSFDNKRARAEKKRREIPVKSSIFQYYDISKDEEKELLASSRSEIHQDIFVYLESGRKKNGFFIEFGAADGFDISNTYMLEKEFGWRGILAEPAKGWHEQLSANRPNAMIETLCVWVKTGETLTFNEVVSHRGLSTIDRYSSSDKHARAREGGVTYTVQTISLLDLLKKYDAPRDIDYLSIDTEGSEFDILSAFFRDNDYYRIKIISCEHNFTESRKKVYDLLKEHGYMRKYEKYSTWEDYYVLVN